MKSFSNTKRASKLQNAEHGQVVYNTCEGKHMHTHANTTDITRELANMKTRSGSVCNTCDHETLSRKCIQHLRPRKREREVYTTLATTITYEGSACSTCKHENLRGQCMQHLQIRIIEKAVHRAPTNTKTYADR